LYSPSELLSLNWSNRYELPMDIIKGYATFHKPDEPCNGAWEVSSIAGIGHGATLYGLGYSLTPNGRLMPDRMFSSKRAKAAWSRAISSEKLNRFPLDDVEEHKEGEPIDPRHEPNHTDDLRDDCQLQVPTAKGGPDPVLDFAYKGPPVDPDPMMRVHDATVKKLMEILNDPEAKYTDPEEVDKMLGGMLKRVSTKYSTSEFQKYYKER